MESLGKFADEVTKVAREVGRTGEGDKCGWQSVGSDG